MEFCRKCGNVFYKKENSSRLHCIPCIKARKKGPKEKQTTYSAIEKVVHVGRDLRYKGGWWKKDDCEHVKHVS